MHHSLRISLGLAALVASLAACGPKKVALNPQSVVNVSVRPRSGQPLFCPGDAFQVEIVTKMDDGSSCSNIDHSRVCMGEDDRIIDPSLLHLRGSHGQESKRFVWMPPSDPLSTAATGLHLDAWLEGPVEGGPSEKSMVGSIDLRPVYQCQMKRVFAAPSQNGWQGQNGVRGPEIRVAVTTLSTPFYPDAALVRVEAPGQRFYLVSPSADRPVEIVTRGQDGAQGARGQAGVAGTAPDGDAPTDPCVRGLKGNPGGPGQAGGRGGRGGDGGLVRITFDAAASDKLRRRVLISSAPGQGGAGGRGGPGGAGGPGGPGGPTDPKQCPNTQGPPGANGQAGPAGPVGAPGQAVTPVTTEMARQQLFGTELTMIQQIEATPAK